MFFVEGYVREDGFGRIVIDRCPSDDEHLRSAPTDPEINKPSCRFLLEEFFTRGTAAEEMLGKKGLLRVSFDFIPETDASEITHAIQKYVEEKVIR